MTVSTKLTSPAMKVETIRTGERALLAALQNCCRAAELAGDRHRDRW